LVPPRPRRRPSRAPAPPRPRGQIIGVAPLLVATGGIPVRQLALPAAVNDGRASHASQRALDSADHARLSGLKRREGKSRKRNEGMTHKWQYEFTTTHHQVGGVQRHVRCVHVVRHRLLDRCGELPRPFNTLDRTQTCDTNCHFFEKVETTMTLEQFCPSLFYFVFSSIRRRHPCSSSFLKIGATAAMAQEVPRDEAPHVVAVQDAQPQPLFVDVSARTTRQRGRTEK